MTCMAIGLGLNRGRGQCLNFFSCSNDCITCIMKSLVNLKKYKNGPVLYLGLKLTIHVIKSQINLETVPLKDKCERLFMTSETDQ
jgi:hypothetical protein